MKNIEGKKITINKKENVIKEDSRKGEAMIGNGTVGIEDKNGEYYVESGRYFSDEKPYFNERAFNLDH